MQILFLYISTSLVFLGLDAVMLRFIMRPLFEHHLGTLLLADLRLGPVTIFYLGYVAGVVWLVSFPALRAGVPTQALVAGAVLGALAYGTYEFTNYATLTAWAPTMVAADLTWGTMLTGFSAWAGVALTSAMLSA